MSDHTVKIGVVMGGPSAEHAISLKSGQGVVEALARLGWQAQAIVMPQALDLEDATQFCRLALDAPQDIDLVFIALHGPFGEDGTIQRLCEELHLAYTGSDVQASRLGLDKVASRTRFEQADLAVPRWRLLDMLMSQDAQDHCLAELRLPLVVKPTNQGSSIGVSIVTHPNEFRAAIDQAGRYDTRALVEEYVRGRELTVGVLGEEALPVVEIQPVRGFFDYTAKYTAGLTRYVVPADLEADCARQVQAAGLRAHQALGCRHFSRVDLILNEANRPVILEVNTIPGLTATSLLPKAAACAGLSYDELCEQIVLMALASSQWQRGKAATQGFSHFSHLAT